MTTEWIKASLALKYAAFGEDEYSVGKAIIDRAHAGIIAAKAQKLFWNDTEGSNCSIPEAFWRSDEIDDDLIANWEHGDFQRSDRYQIAEQAFGVCFDFLALSELVPSHLQAAAMRRISMLSDNDWLSAHELRNLLASVKNYADVERAIVEACQLGHIAARASRVVCEGLDSGSKFDPLSSYGTIEWDVPLWFWRDFVRPDHFQDWSLNKAHGSGRRDGNELKINLQGVHFHRSGLVNLGVEKYATSPSPGQAKLGRSPKYDWPAACLAIFGDIYRGTLQPSSQADLELALISQLGDGGDEPAQSTVRPYARKIWSEFRKD